MNDAKQLAQSARTWRADQMPPQSGRTVVVTGGNSGLGFETVKVFARKGARTVLACRDLPRGRDARERIWAETPDAPIEVIRLDVASLGSIQQFVDEFRAKHDRLDCLVNNAGVMATPRRATADGFELQFGTNHLGHFALTGLLLDSLLAVPQSRVVTVSSAVERFGAIRFADLHGERSYDRWAAYGQSKLANLLFAYELQRKLTLIHSTTLSVAAHPGFAATGLRADLMQHERSWLHRTMGNIFESWSQSASMGALPQLYAATAPGVRGGEYYGPNGFLERAGFPQRLRSSGRSYDPELAQRLWDVSADLTSVRYKALAS